MRNWLFEAMQLIRERPTEEIEFIYQILTMEEEAKEAFLLAYHLIKARDAELASQPIERRDSLFPLLRIEGDLGMYIHE